MAYPSEHDIIYYRNKEFEERPKSIVEIELKKITTMVKKIPDKNAKKQATLLGLSTIDIDIKRNPLAFNVLKNFVDNLILEQVEGKSEKINYERIISEIVNHIMTFCIAFYDKSCKYSKTRSLYLVAWRDSLLA